MDKRILQKSKIELSIIGLGCWAFGDPIFWGPLNVFDAYNTISSAIDNGITFFDTAEGYGEGESERFLGNALKGRRDKVVIATKMIPGRNGGKELRKACEDSLRRLQTDYIDLYQVHWPNRDVALTETITALEKLKQDGKIKAAGVCNFGIRDLTSVLELSNQVETNQMVYNLLWRAVEGEVLPKCLKHKIGVICYSSLMQGLLTGRYEKTEDVPKYLKQTKIYSTRLETQAFSTIIKIHEISKDAGIPMNVLAIHWVLSQPGVVSVLTGAQKPEEIVSNIKALEWKVPVDVLEALDKITIPMKEEVGLDLDLWTEGRIQ